MKSISEVIKQSAFASNYEMAVINVLFTSNHLKNDSAAIFKKHGILQQHYNILRIVNGRHGEAVTPGDIKEVIMDKGRDITRLVDKLVKLGYLVKEADKVNGRQKNIYITKQGQSLIKEISDWMKVHVFQSPNLSEAEAETLSSLLDKLRG